MVYKSYFSGTHPPTSPAYGLSQQNKSPKMSSTCPMDSLYKNHLFAKQSFPVFGDKTPIWLVVSTHLKNISQNVNLPQLGVKIKNIWNHLAINNSSCMVVVYLFLTSFWKSTNKTPHPTPNLHRLLDWVPSLVEPDDPKHRIPTPAICFFKWRVKCCHQCLEKTQTLNVKPVERSTTLENHGIWILKKNTRNWMFPKMVVPPNHPP